MVRERHPRAGRHNVTAAATPLHRRALALSRVLLRLLLLLLMSIAAVLNIAHQCVKKAILGFSGSARPPATARLESRRCRHKDAIDG